MDREMTRVALVTGCGKAVGIGAAIARALSASGAAVVVSDVLPSGVADASEIPAKTARDGLTALVAEIVAAGGRASAMQGDISLEADANRLISETVDRFGRLDILVNNAGAPHGSDRADIEQVTLDAWERVMSVNLRGVFLMSRAAVAPMRRQGWGRIVNISSAVAGQGALHRTAYVASKAGVVGFTKSLALDVARSGITVNAICPGSIKTSRAVDTTRKLGWDDVEAGLADRAKTIPLGRHGETEEVAALACFLASENSAYLTGQAIYLDGGGLPQRAY